MIYVIQSPKMRVEISSKGGEIFSIQNPEGLEYVWQGNPQYWASRAPHLFPFVGRFTDGKYIMDKTEHEMGIHGFFRHREMTVVEQGADHITLMMESDDETRAQYPRDWTVYLMYMVNGATLNICFQVQNHDSRVMYCGYGGHPGFNVPLAAGLHFEDYELVFGRACRPNSINMSPTAFVTEGTTPLPLENDTTLRLRHEMFDHDAMVMRDMADSVTLRSDRDPHSVTVHYPQMPFLGLWQKSLAQAPYLCIEPWVSLPSRQDVVEEFETKGDLIDILPGDAYKNCWSISIT